MLGKYKGILPLILISMVLGSFSWAGEESENLSEVIGEGGAESCDRFLEQFHPDGKKALEKVDPRMVAFAETHKFQEIVSPREDENLVGKQPWLAMSAAQRVLSLVYSQGVREIVDPNTGAGRRKVYSLFSDGVPLAGGMRVIGHEEAIETFVAQLEALARGDRSGLYPVLLVGLPGSGKSEMLKILRSALSNATLRNPEFAVPTYSWKIEELAKIPELRKHLPNMEAGERGLKPCPLHDSPFTLLPDDYQEAVIRKASPTVAKLTQGLQPLPKRKPCPHCAFFRASIINHLAHEKGRMLKPSEVVEAMNRFVVVKRVVLGDPGTAPLLAKQAKDVDWSGLFVSKNPIEFIQSGPSHPLSYNLNGALLGGNGSVTFLDEAGKNTMDLLGKLLNTIQDRSVSEGGAPLVDIDTVFILATNTKDVSKIKEVDPDSPFLDRVAQAPMNWSVRPDEIIKVAAYEIQGLHMQKLGVADAPVVAVPENLDEFVPRAEARKPVLTSDRRYNLTVDRGDKRVHISPHALLYLADVVALSRMNFDPKAVEKFGKYPLVASPIYSDPVSRIKAIMGEKPMTQSQAIEFWKLSTLTQEGTKGISPRDVARWISAALAEASKADNGYCVTPALLKQVLNNLILKGKIGNTTEDRLLYANISKLVAQNFTIPALREDLMTAMSGSQNEVVAQVYDEIIEEMGALHQDPDAKTYIPAGTNQPTEIRKQRLEQIRALYRQRIGQDLSFSEISMFHFNLRRNKNVGAENERHRGLLSVIHEWESMKIAAARDSNVQKLIRIASGRSQGTSEDRDLVQQLMGSLEHQHGYCPHCAARALELIEEQPDVQSIPVKQE